MTPSLLKSQSGNEDIASSKPDTKQGLAKTTSLKENNSQKITKREQLEKLMAKEADPKRIPEIEKLNDSINNTKSPETNKNFFTKGIEIVFNTLDKRLIKPIIKLAQQIASFKSGKEGTSSENAEDPEQAKLIQEIANKKLDLSKVKDPKERKRIEVLQKRLGDEGLKLSAETKGALVEIIRGAETKGEFNQAALPECCRMPEIGEETRQGTKSMAERLIGNRDGSDIRLYLSYTDIPHSTQSLRSTSSSGQTRLNSPFLSFIKKAVSEVRENLSKGNLSQEQKTLFSELMLKSEIRQNLRESFCKSDSKTTEIIAQLINQELPFHEKNNPEAPKLKDYQRFMHDTCIGGVEAKNTNVNQKNENLYKAIETKYGKETSEEVKKRDNASQKLRELYNANPALEKQTNQKVRERKGTDSEFKDRLKDNRDTVLLEIAREIAAEKKDSESNSAKTILKEPQIHDSPASANQHATTEAVKTTKETVTHHTEIVKQAANNNNPSTVSTESISPKTTENHEEKQTIRG